MLQFVDVVFIVLLPSDRPRLAKLVAEVNSSSEAVRGSEILSFRTLPALISSAPSGSVPMKVQLSSSAGSSNEYAVSGWWRAEPVVCFSTLALIRLLAYSRSR